MKQRVIILCTGNSCRSQMAEGFFKKFGSEKFEIFSAGVNPTAKNPSAVAVMKEEKIDISDQTSKSVTLFLTEKFDYVITVCDNAKQTCPVFPGQYEKIHWNIEDPAGSEGSKDEILRVFRKTRDEIKLQVLKFVSSNPH